MKIKTAALSHFKAIDGEPAGTFEAIVSVFGNVDLAGDRVVQGAFAKSLTTWAESGDPIPVIWSHQWQDPEMHIGGVLQAEERDEGLWVKAQLDVAEDPVAAKVWRLLSTRRVREFSFAYDVHDEKRQNGANELLELDVIEVGPTLKGMNPDTLLLEAKSRRAARAARLAKADEDTDDTATDGSEDATTEDLDEGQGAGDGDAGDDETSAPSEQGDSSAEPGDPDPAEDDPAGVAKASELTRRGTKAQVTLDGSYEQLQERLSAAVTVWAAAAFPDADIYLAGLEATYPDHVVVYVETWSQPWGGGDYHSAPYEVTADGVASLGDPAPIELIGVAVPKACTDLAHTKKSQNPPAQPEQFSDPASVHAELDLVELGG